MRISKFFEDVLGAKLSNSRWSWGAFNPNTKQLFLRVWDDTLETVNGVERIPVLRTDRVGTSVGFPERKRHVEEMRKGAEAYGVIYTAKDINTPADKRATDHVPGVICTAKDIDTTGSRSIKEFDHDVLLQFGTLVEDGNCVYAQVVGRISVEDLARRQAAYSSSLAPDLKSILGKRVDATAKEALINARIGQGKFREQVLEHWGGRCCVTGSEILAAIRASHIKPWCISNDDERLDPDNGLPLIATLDALFDAGLVTFASDGQLLTSRQLDKEKKLLGLAGLRLAREPNAQTAKYLSDHREHTFVDNKAT